MAGLSVDELARACAESMYARDVASQSLGIQIEEVKAGFARVTMSIRDDMLNGYQICHGGFLFALADTAFAYACNSYNRLSLAQSCSIDFVRPGQAGEELYAQAEERSRQGRTGLYDITVSRADGEVLAHFRGRSYSIKGEVIADSARL